MEIINKDMLGIDGYGDVFDVGVLGICNPTAITPPGCHTIIPTCPLFWGGGNPDPVGPCPALETITSQNYIK